MQQQVVNYRALLGQPNRRLKARYNVSLTSQYFLEPNCQVGEGKVVNMGKGGLMLETKYPLVQTNVGQRIMVLIDWPSMHLSHMKVFGIVHWISEADDSGKKKMGVAMHRYEQVA